MQIEQEKPMRLNGEETHAARTTEMRLNRGGGTHLQSEPHEHPRVLKRRGLGLVVHDPRPGDRRTAEREAQRGGDAVVELWPRGVVRGQLCAGEQEQRG